MTLNEFKEVFTYLLDNNKLLEDQGQRPVAIGVEGAAGIGKTSLIENIAREKGMTMCKINLAQLEEVGD
jgi:midasin (ATPase involved in ribosome maturation)